MSYQKNNGFDAQKFGHILEIIKNNFPMNSEVTVEQKFFSFVDFTWSKELSDQWIFLKQNLCHKQMCRVSI